MVAMVPSTPPTYANAGLECERSPRTLGITTWYHNSTAHGRTLSSRKIQAAGYKIERPRSNLFAGVGIITREPLLGRLALWTPEVRRQLIEGRAAQPRSTLLGCCKLHRHSRVRFAALHPVTCCVRPYDQRERLLGRSEQGQSVLICPDGEHGWHASCMTPHTLYLCIRVNMQWTNTAHLSA